MATNQQGNLENCGNVLHYPKATRNILSLNNINKKSLIVDDSENGDIFIVINTRPKRHLMIFTVDNGGI